jgi:uncharacterized protein YecA (UPF0149 family)
MNIHHDLEKISLAAHYHAEQQFGKPFFLTDTTLYDNPTAEFERRFATPIVRTSPKIGNNEPCPCKSGMKYKKCCRDKNAC